MNRPVRTGTDPDEARARILEVAEDHFRRVGYHKTSMADIASELGMSPANVYRFFPSRDAVNVSICGRVLNEVADIASAIARMNVPPVEKLDRLLTAVHRHNKMTLVEQKHMHDLIVVAMHENWTITKAHSNGWWRSSRRSYARASKQESSRSKMPRKPRELSKSPSRHSSIRL